MSNIAQAGRLIIGLGGVGGQYINSVSEALTKLGEETPTQAREKSQVFLAIDSNNEALSRLNAIDIENRILVAPPNPALIKKANPWMSLELAQARGGIGSGNRRAYGKGLYVTYRGLILDIIKKKVDEVAGFIGTNNFLVVIVNALGGGTGSGMLIDLAIDIRDVILKNYGQDPFMVGIGVLPHSKESDINRANSMGAIKELHFLLNTIEELQIGDRKYVNPFHIFFLMGREIKGQTRDDDLEEALQRFLVDLGFVPHKFITKEIKGHRLDLNDIIEKVSGSQNKFSTLGFYQVYIPVQELLWYFDSEEILNRVERRIDELDLSFKDIENKVDVLKRERIGTQDLIENTLRTSAKIETERRIYKNLRVRIQNVKGELNKKYASLTDDFTNNIEAIESYLYSLEKDIRKTRAEAKFLKGTMNKIIKNVSNGELKTTYRQLPFEEKNISYVREVRGGIRKTNFRELMEKFNRFGEYLDRTHRDISQLNIMLEPLLNYRHLSTREIHVKPDTLRYLLEIRATTKSPKGEVLLNEAKVGWICAMISSCPENILSEHLAQATFKDFIEANIANDSELRILFTPARKFTFAVYWLMNGISLTSIVPGEQPRLQDLTWMSKAYNKKIEEGQRELVARHAFLLGEPAVLAQMKKESFLGVTPEEGRKYVLDFWRQYEPVDEDAATMQAIMGLAETIVHLQTLIRSFAGFKDLETMVLDLSTSEISDEILLRVTSRLSVARIESSKTSNSFFDMSEELRDDTKKFEDVIFSFIRVKTIKENKFETLNHEVARIGDLLNEAMSHISQVKSSISEIQKALLNIKALIREKISGAVRRMDIERDLDQINTVLERTSKKLPMLQDNIFAMPRLVENIQSHLSIIKKE